MRFGTYLQSHFIFKNRERLFLDLYLPPMGRGERPFLIAVNLFIVSPPPHSFNRVQVLQILLPIVIVYLLLLFTYC